MATSLSVPTQLPTVEGLGNIILQLYAKNICALDGQTALEIITSVIPKLRKKLPNLWGIWLAGFLDSNPDDPGFAVRNDCAINPKYGTMEQLAELIHCADSYEVKVGMDVVLHHSAPQNDLVQKCIRGEPGYSEVLVSVSHREALRLAEQGIAKDLIFFGKHLYAEIGGRHYLNVFADYDPVRGYGQLDLNWDCPAVQRHFSNVFDFWAERGIGFARLDCVSLLAKDLSRAKPRNPLGLYLPERSYQLAREAAHGSMLLLGECFDIADVQYVKDWPEFYLEDCRSVLTGKFTTEDWRSSPKIVPVTGDHDAMTLGDRGYNDEKINHIFRLAKRQPLYVTNLLALLHAHTDPRIYPEDFQNDAMLGGPNPQERWRVRRERDLAHDVESLTHAHYMV